MGGFCQDAIFGYLRDFFALLDRLREIIRKEIDATEPIE
jgi:hypothetical protein